LGLPQRGDERRSDDKHRTGKLRSGKTYRPFGDTFVPTKPFTDDAINSTINVSNDARIMSPMVCL